MTDSQRLEFDQLPALPPRKPESHKGDFGRALLIGGSLGMAGSISLTAMATLRSGAGLVKVAVPDCILPTVAGFEPSYMTIPLPCDNAGQLSVSGKSQMLEACQAATVIGIGPGLGRGDDINQLVQEIYRQVEVPLVIDADGLNALAADASVLNRHAGPRILTPHPGEFKRLTDGLAIDAGDREGAAAAVAEKWQAVVVLKGHRTVISDGERTLVNTTGNPGLATGGTGDVLTGMITGLLAQSLAPLEAAQLGTYLHGLAGDMAVRELGEVGLIASDLLQFIPGAIMHLRQA